MNYNSKRRRFLFDPTSIEPFRLSRSKLELFMQCRRCFYLDRRFGISQPGGFPFTLNSAVDALLKKEFDIHRARGEAHPLMQHYRIDAIPFAHEKLAAWRENFQGVEYYHQKTALIVTGAVDDIWQSPAGELIVVDYKATSKDEAVGIDADWQAGYRRQMEIYQWLLRQNGFPVSDTGYFVYANGKKDREAFDGKLEFDVTIHAYKGDDSWVEQAVISAHECLMAESLPDPAPDCAFCNYREKAALVEKP